MADFGDKKNKDIKGRLKNTDLNRTPDAIKSGGTAAPGSQSNLNAESKKATIQGKSVGLTGTGVELPKYGTKATPGMQHNTGASGLKPKEQNGIVGLETGTAQAIFDNSARPVIDRPGSTSIPKVTVRTHDTELMKLQAKIPNTGKVGSGLEIAINVGQPGANTGTKSQSSKSEYNTKLKNKIALGLRYRIPKKLEKLVTEDPDCIKKLSAYISEQLNINQKNRTEMLERIFNFREAWRNFEEAGLNIDIDGQHNEHIPLIFEKGKALHARIYSAIMSVEPPFVLLPRKAVDEKMKQNKEDLLRWVIADYMNYSEGIAVETDKDIWNFVLDGTAIEKHYWDRDVRKFVDVKSEPKLPLELDENGQIVMDEIEEEKEAVVYDGPMMKIVPLEDMYIVGPKAEGIDDADMVAHRQFYSKSDVIKMANLGFFMQDAVDELIKRTPTAESRTKGWDSDLTQQELRLSGLTGDGGIPMYTVHETYLRYDIDKDGIDEEIVVWRDWDSGLILRLTYLDRVSPTGKRPFVLKKLIPMAGTPYGLGFGEMLYGINNLLDYIANQRLDAGTFNTFPWFVYRAGSGIQDSDIRIGPGKGIPVDSVNDIAFPKVNGNPAYGFQEEQLITDYAERVSGVSRLAQGQMGGQGIARTATGAASLVSELNTNLDIFIKRYQFGFKKSLRIIDKQCQELLPLGLEYRITGMAPGGQAYKRFADREEIKFDCDFDLVGNSINSNPAIERDVATQLLQYALNPIMLQTGIVGPKQIYNVYKNLLQKMDVRDIESYAQSPDGIEGPQFTAQDEVNAIASGVELPVNPNDDHVKKLAYYNEFENSPEFGFLTQDHIPLYAKMKAKHEQYAAAISAQAPLAANTGGMIDPALAAQIASSSGNPQQGVPQQITDLAGTSSGVNNG